MNYDIAVVMATYKRTDLLRRCLHCLTMQTIEKNRYQVIVVSDGPDENARLLVAAYQRNYPLIQFRFENTPKNEGPANARNIGWKCADARLIAFTDDDCLPEPSWLEAFLVTDALRPGQAVMTGRVVVPISGIPTDYEKNIAGLETADFVTANCCSPLHVLQKVCGFDSRFKTAWREDSDLHFKLLNHDIPIVKVSRAVVVHPVRKASWAVSLKEQRKSMYNALLYKKYPGYYRQLIAKAPVWDYYIMVISVIGSLFAFALKSPLVGSVLVLNWFIWLCGFIHRRLAGTSKSLPHIFEMIVTSVIIPFTSIYWTLYGSFKYRVLFL
jgi:GT2 family glycosyltransferase